MEGSGGGSVGAIGERLESRGGGSAAQDVPGRDAELAPPGEPPDRAGLGIGVRPAVEQSYQSLLGPDAVPYVIDRLIVSESRDELRDPIDQVPQEPSRSEKQAQTLSGERIVLEEGDQGGVVRGMGEQEPQLGESEIGVG